MGMRWTWVGCRWHDNSPAPGRNALMAWLEKRGDTFHVLFRLGARRFKGTLRTGNSHSAA